MSGVLFTLDLDLICPPCADGPPDGVATAYGTDRGVAQAYGGTSSAAVAWGGGRGVSVATSRIAGEAQAFGSMVPGVAVAEGDT